MTRPRLASLWLALPSRFSGLTRRDARIGAALLGVLLLATLLACLTPPPPAATGAPAGEQTDLLLYGTVVENVRHGGDYYLVTADALRAGDYPLKPFVTFRLPTLARVQAMLPPWAVSMLLYALAAAVAFAWYGQLRPALSRAPPLILALGLLAAGMLAFVQADLTPFHEIWAGLLIALSLGTWRPDDWLASVAFGLAAALIRETAGLYLLLMAGLALLTGDRREGASWLVAGAILSMILLVHAHAVEQVVRPLDAWSPGWAGQLGFGFFVRTITISTALALVPQWLAALAVGLSLFGWAAWRSPLALRVLVLLAAYAAVLSIFGRADTFYWGLLVAPLSLVGLVFAPDGVRDLLAAVLDRRRITVRRVLR